MKTIPLLVASLLVAGNWVFAEEEPDLDDPKVREKILKDAVPIESLEKRGPDGKKMCYQAGKETPYTGWAKAVYDNGQVEFLAHFKDGEAEGLFAAWHENGKMAEQGHNKGGQREGLWTGWDENGKVVKQVRYKDGEEFKE